ncbi:MAG TPA: hypothetical protein VIM56_13980 [Rhizomicrobium sp.]
MGGAAPAEFAQYGFDDSIQVLPNLRVPKAQNNVAFVCDGEITLHVIRSVLSKAVLTTIEFDSKAAAVLREVEEIAAQGDLSAEVKTLCVQLAQFPPEQALGVGSGVAQLAGTLDRSAL